MIKRISLVAFIALFTTLSLSAQLLWKISGNGLTQPSYLFGTHHLIEKEQIPHFDKVLSYCSKADAMVGEVDMSDINAVQTKLMQGSMMQGTTYKELLTTADYTMVDNEFKLLMRIGMDQLGVMKPIMLHTLFVSQVYLKSNGLSKQPEAVDLIFQKSAKTNDKKVIGLETVEEEMEALFNSIPLKRQAEVLVKDIREKQKGIDLLKRVNTAYLSGDMALVETLDKEDDSMTPDEKKPLLDNRNASWLKQLPSLMRTQSCFIAVGFQHLVGELGLISQLRKSGYKIEPVML